MKTGKRFLSLLLSGMMLFSLWPQTALAEGAQDSGTQGLFFSEEYDAQKCTGTGEGFAACEDTKTEIATLSNARAADTAHDISQSTLTISQNGSYTVTGTTTTNCIIVNSGVTATITLDGVNITAPEYQSAIDVKDNANLTIILQDNTTSTLVGGFATGSHGAPGIHVPRKATVTIQGGGELNVTGGGSGSSHGGAGIGGKAGSGPVRPEDCGTVMILGGTVSITGGSTGSGSFSGVGIGGGSYTQDIGGAGGTVIILGGSVSVTSGKGGSGTADIGAGDANYHGASDGQGIKPAGDSTYTVYGNLTLPCDITIPDGATVTIPEGTSLTVPEGVKLTNNGSITGAGSVIVNGDVSGSGSMSVTGTVTKKDQDAPDAPGSTTNVTDTSVTLRPVTTSDGGGGIEYGYTTGDETSVPEERWQSGTTFSNLAAATPYTFYARRAGNAYYKPSPASAVGLTVTTLPAAPESSAVAIDYAAETISFDSDTLEMGTSEDITSGTAISSGSSIVSHMGQTVYVRFKANGGIPASAPVEINIPARPAAPALTIDNQAEGVTLSSEYYYSTTGVDYNTWTQGDGSLVKIEPGSSIYIYKAAVASGADAAFKSAVQTLTAPARGNRPNVPAIDYEAEALTGTTTAMEYTLEQSTPGRWTACTEGMALSALGWEGGAMTVQFRAAATNTNYASEATETLTIPARPAAPEVQGVDETFEKEQDGKITDVTTAMEYKLDTASEWTACTGTEITNLAPGTYQVRLAVTKSAFAGTPAEVTIAAGEKRTYTLSVTAPTFDSVYTGYTQPEAKAITITSSGNSNAAISGVTVSGTDFTISGSGNFVPAGGSITTWTVQPAAGLAAGTYTATITLTYNDGVTASAEVKFIVSQPPAPTPTYSDRTLVSGGVSLSGSGIHRDARLTVTEGKLHESAESGEPCAVCGRLEQWQERGRILAIYDVSLSREFWGTVTLTFPVPEGYEGKTLTILHCLYGEPESRDVKVTDGEVQITVDSLSPFAILEKRDLAECDVEISGDTVTVTDQGMEVPSDEYTVTRAADTLTVTASADSAFYTGSRTVSLLPESTALTVTGRTTSTVSLSWDQVEGAEGYTIWFRSEYDDTLSRHIIWDGDTTEWTHKGLQPGTKYFYKIRAWVTDENGKYVFSDIEEALTQRGTTKPEAAKITGVTVTGGKIKVRLAGENRAERTARDPKQSRSARFWFQRKMQTGCSQSIKSVV